MSAEFRPTLTLCDLEIYDPHAPHSTPERRFCCTFCGDSKPKDAAHRSLAVNVRSGAFKCYRCGTSGKLREFWKVPDHSQADARPRRFGRVQAKQRAVALSTFEVPTSANVVATQPNATPERWRTDWDASAPLRGSHGESYLNSRSIPCDLATAAGVRWSANWFGRAAVLFPLCDRSGFLIAAQGRYLAAYDGKPKAVTGGPKKQSIFATPDAFADLKRGAPLVLTEAPIDALSIAAAGFPAFAFCGTSAPTWLHLVAGLRRVLIATDADDAGDRAADEITAQVHPFGASVRRMRPEGAKDWNEFLVAYGVDALSDFLAPLILGGS